MNGENYEVPHFGAFSTRHSHPSWARIFALGSCFQTLSLHSSLNVRDHVSEPYSTTGNMIIVFKKSRSLFLGPSISWESLVNRYDPEANSTRALYTTSLISWRYWEAGKIHDAYDGSRATYTSTLHWNSLGLPKNRVEYFSNRIVFPFNLMASVVLS